MIASPTDLIYFREIAQSLNLTRTAEKLNISQPSLTLAIQRLEKITKAPLLLRHKRGVTLTKAGKLLLTRADQLIQDWQRIQEEVEAAYVNPEGQLTVGCHSSVALHIIPEFLPTVLKLYPRLAIKLIHDFSYKLIDKIANFEIDVGILVNPIKQADLVIKPLYKDYDAVWYAPRKIHSANFKDMTLFCDIDRSQTQILLKKFKKHKLTFSRIITSSNLEMLAALTCSGTGVGILPAKVATSIGKQHLQQIKDSPITTDEICLVYHYNNKNVGTLRAFIESITKFYSG